MGKLTVVTSGKGGAGKSTFSVGLATALKKRHKKVLLIDCDEGLRCLDLMLGVSERLVFDLSDILLGSRPLEDVAIKVDENISLVAAPARVNGFNRAAFGKFLLKITDLYDHIIVDCPAGIDKALYESLPSFVSVLIIETLDAIGCRSASILDDVLFNCGIENRFLIINKFDYFYLKARNMISIDEIIDKSGLKIKGIVPYDVELSHLSALGRLYNDSEAFNSYLRIADRLNGLDVPLPKLKKL